MNYSIDEQYRAVYRDEHGEEKTVIFTDGKQLKMTLRGVEFVSSMLDDFEPVEGTDPATLTPFFLHLNAPCGCSTVWMFYCVDVLLCGCSTVWMFYCVDVILCGCSTVWMLYCVDVLLSTRPRLGHPHGICSGNVLLPRIRVPCA
jgi:hypothetical protein